MIAIDLVILNPFHHFMIQGATEKSLRSHAGSLLHFDDTHLNDLYFLDPEWLAKFMAEVISPDSPAEKCHGKACSVCMFLRVTV